MKAFTAIEMLVTLAVLGILLAFSFPYFRTMLESRRTRGAAEMLMSDIQMARMESVKRSAPVSISFSVASWCYGVSANPLCDCDSNPGACDIRTVNGSDFPGTRLEEDFDDDRLVFNPVRNTANMGTATFSSQGKSYSVKVNALGHARICQPGAPSGSNLSC